MKIDESLFAATLATGVSFLLYYVVRNVLYARVFKKYPKSAGLFETIVLMVVISAPFVTILPGREERYSYFLPIVALYFAFVFFCFLVNYIVVSCFNPPNRDVYKKPYQQLQYTLQCRSVFLEKDTIVLRLKKDQYGDYDFDVKPTDGAKPLPKHLSIKASFYFFEEPV